ncbi:DUF5107 domain-containing protein [Companilactobacillus alimentarius]|uniref:DUF5107 domain-containing protein n=1 Tax=Companilactobacillus alimentarius DSM 20249 TaxID=1423720 RepID=A0A2K9HEV4_9LACO|nr:DUF5107 domain-containing protein [Companilactobacillus alimentarius]AUI71089.1 DUF5107 domain-containing protein [Companilactobacillus alimentarius DSM 20249]KRK75209.1 TPR repeat-containing protein [Companilactobacillus alimentarius DSM 20249]GEO44012.1 hypothetical protein LAL01_02440 [Companilactobacillus alimentarius]
MDTIKNKNNLKVTVTEKKITIPTYKTGKPEKNPMFLENRAYQGSSGKVYPYPVTEKIKDIKEDKVYTAIILENKYVQITFLPELGGRIQRMIDKTNNYDFVYYNHVIKPALVGLAGPWISGGIELNWPQHHRPDTYLPVNYSIKSNSDGSKTVWMSDVDRMYGTKIVIGFTLFKDRSYLKLEETFSNPTELPQTFLWWANPAVPVNEHTQSIFPPDVHAVFDHGKRAVSTFPIATGEYYKMDYSAGVDISRYKNIPVPTSYMAAHSDYDFLGNYDYQKQAGLLHVADHHTSPGKKQWTWGNGDFGKAWDHQLTDNDGPYIELMVGTFTDNQPDFTWLKPHEQKRSTEYFMPYRAVGAVKNATIKGAINLSKDDDRVTIAAYTTSEYRNAHLELKYDQQVIRNIKVNIAPDKPFTTELSGIDHPLKGLSLSLFDCNNELLVKYLPKDKKIEKIPDPAEAIPVPQELKTNDELFFAGQHLEQYRHASFQPKDYYLEGLKRDPDDERINDAYGLILFRNGLFAKSEKYFKNAIKRSNEHNTNPVSGAPMYHLGLSLVKQGRIEEAYDDFFKATWSDNTKAISFFEMAKLKLRSKDYQKALDFIQQSSNYNYCDTTNKFLEIHVLNLLAQSQAAKNILEHSLKFDPLNLGLLYELSQIDPDNQTNSKLLIKASTKLNDILNLASLFIETGQYADAINVLNLSESQNPLKEYYLAYVFDLIGQNKAALKHAQTGANLSPDYVFPNNLFDILVLQKIIRLNPQDGLANYYLGNINYDRKNYNLAQEYWEKCTQLNPDYPMAYRNLSIKYFNKDNNSKRALIALETSFKLDPNNARLVFELDTLYEKLNHSLTDRLSFLTSHENLVKQRDDSYIQLITLLNDTGKYQQAYDKIMVHNFHPWEGGEGKVSTQYKYSLVELAKIDLQEKNPLKAIEKLTKALTYPENIGEGKLVTLHENIVTYYLGLAYKMVDDSQNSIFYLTEATKGIVEPTNMMYYNDEPADAIFYQGLAWEQLGEQKKAVAKYHKLLTYGEKHLFDKITADYFAVSLPDSLLFDENHQNKNSINCYYLMGLGYLGLQQTNNAKKMFTKINNLTNHFQEVKRQDLFKDEIESDLS